MSDDNRFESVPTSLTSVGENYLGRLLSLDTSYYQRLFALLLLGFVVVVIGLSLTYPRDARLFPLVVAVPTLVVLVAILTLLSVPRFREYAGQFSSSTSFADEAFDEKTDWKSGADGSVETIRANALRTLGWICYFLAAILLFGHVIGLAIVLTVVFRYYSELPWLRAVGLALVNVAVLAGLFLVVFNARLYPGIFLA